MTIDRFIDIIPKIKELIIDSNVPHLKMAPPFRKDLLQMTRNNYKNSKKAGVAVLFHPNNNNKVCFTLILRNEYNFGLPSLKYT